MPKSKHRFSGAPSNTLPNPFDEARDELFQHIMRCEVIGSAPEYQTEWFDDTMKYMAERYPELAKRDFEELKTLGLRFAQPPKTNPAVAEEAVSAA
ncbi:MAG TPA: hypothetical protein VFK16_00240 [Gemmatimonadaceae bacterium]|jgi:hypothetical protein|nr:hypothetical protein [Gemmatimonadaceae bacterium]